MRTISIDYNRIGHAKTFRTTLLSDERDGDDVPEREAVITDLTDGARNAKLSFCD